MGLNFLYHFYQQLFSKSVDFEEKLNISHNFSKNEETYYVRNFKLKEKTKNSRKIIKN